jgi:hypothetical protein
MENADKRLEKLAKEAGNLSNLYKEYWKEESTQRKTAVHIYKGLSVRQCIELCDYLSQYGNITEVYRAREDLKLNITGGFSPAVILSCSEENEKKICKEFEQNKDNLPFCYIRKVEKVYTKEDIKKGVFGKLK